MPDQKNPPLPSGLRRLAAETGLSIATISRALNNSEKVREATRNRVHEAAERLGYSPNAAARALTTRRSRTIGAVIPTLESSIFAKFISAIEEQLAADGYALVIATTNNDAEIEEKRALELVSMGAEGLIVSGLRHQPGLIRYIRSRDIPAIATSIFSSRGQLPSIGYDSRLLGRMAAQYLVGQGHRNIAVIHGPLHNNDRTRLRLEGVNSIVENARALEVPLTVGGGVDATRVMMQCDKPPSALLCLSDVLALGTLFEAPRLGFKIPRDVSVMGFDDLDWAASANPPLTTIALPVAEMGRQSARAIVDNLERQQPIRGKRLEGQIVERKSVLPG